MQVLNTENEKKMDLKEFYFSLDPKFFKGLVEGISSIVEETKFVLDNKKGLKLIAMDTSHICLIAVNIDKDDLDFQCENGKVEIAINFKDFKKIVDRAKNNDTLKFKNNPKSNENVILEILPEKGGRVKTFTLNKIDFEGDEIQLENLEEMEYPNTFEYLLSDLDDNIKDAKVYSEVIQINVDKNLEFSTSGNVGNYKDEIEKGQLISCDFTEESKGIFALTYLENILKIGNIMGKKNTNAFKNANFQISLKTDAPLKIVYKLLDYSKIIYFLAPRVEEDDDDDYYYRDKKNPEIEKKMKKITFIKNEIRIAENQKSTIMNEIRIIEDQKVKDQKKAFEESENGNMELAISLLNDVKQCNKDISAKKEMIEDIDASIVLLEKNL